MKKEQTPREIAMEIAGKYNLRAEVEKLAQILMTHGHDEEQAYAAALIEWDL